MKPFTLLFLTLSTLFAGGDFLPVDPVTKFEEMDNAIVSAEPIEIQSTVQKPTTTVKKKKDCGCGEPAKLLPYYGENIPDAKTSRCILGCVHDL
jgi:hypothetical protein